MCLKDFNQIFPNFIVLLTIIILKQASPSSLYKSMASVYIIYMYHIYVYTAEENYKYFPHILYLHSH